MRQTLFIDELTDRLESLRLLRLSDPSAASTLLESFGTQGVVESDIVEESADLSPIAHPERFAVAHRRVMRAFEVYDRNGPRKPSVPASVPRFLRAPASSLVRVPVRMIVRKHLQNAPPSASERVWPGPSGFARPSIQQVRQAHLALRKQSAVLID